MLSRLGLIGDVHAEDELLETTLRALRRAGVDRVLQVGDIADGRGSVDRCCRLLEEAEALVVRGNHDRWCLAGQMRGLGDATRAVELEPRTRAFLAALPPTRLVETVRGRLLLCHGLGEDDMARLRPDDEGYALTANLPLQRLLAAPPAELVVGGHTHQRMVRRLGALTLINAGTLHPAYGPGFLLADLEKGRIECFDLWDRDVVPAGVVVLS